jgi:hypothetical protein
LRVGEVVGVDVVGVAVVGMDVVGVAVGEAVGFEVVGVAVVRGVAFVGEEDGLEVVGVEEVGDLLGLEVVGDSVGVEVVGLDVGFDEVGKLVEIAVVGIEVGAVVTCNFREMECMSDAGVSLSSPFSPFGFKMYLSLFTSADDSSSISSKTFNSEISSNSSFSSSVDS